MGWPGRMTSPAYSAKRPSEPRFTEPCRWPAAKSAGAGVEDHSALVAKRERTVDGERRQGSVGVEQIVYLAVALGVEAEVGGRRRLALRHHADEVVDAHGRQRVVRGPLRTDGGRRLAREVLATG